jgi:hypothetical protein
LVLQHKREATNINSSLPTINYILYFFSSQNYQETAHFFKMETEHHENTSPERDQDTRGEFTFFPQLPLELRWLIYGLAITKPKMLVVKVENSTTIPEDKTIAFNFRVVEPSRQCSALLAVCKESREEYLKNCPASLPAPQDGNLIRYNPDDTVVYISHFMSRFLVDKNIMKAIKKKWKMQPWAKEIKRLGIAGEDLSYSYEADRKGDSDARIGPLMDVFENLEEWIILDNTILTMLGEDDYHLLKVKSEMVCNAITVITQRQEERVGFIRESLKQHQSRRKRAVNGPAILRKEAILSKHLRGYPADFK